MKIVREIESLGESLWSVMLKEEKGWKVEYFWIWEKMKEEGEIEGFLTQIRPSYRGMTLRLNFFTIYLAHATAWINHVVACWMLAVDSSSVHAATWMFRAAACCSWVFEWGSSCRGMSLIFCPCEFFSYAVFLFMLYGPCKCRKPWIYALYDTNLY